MREILHRRDRDPAAGSMPDDAGSSASLFGPFYISPFCAGSLCDPAQKGETYETLNRPMTQPFFLGTLRSPSR